MAQHKAHPETDPRPASPLWTELLIGARLADMEDGHYRNTLALTALIELLTAKGILRPKELSAMCTQLDQEAEAALRPTRAVPAPPSA